MTKDEALQLVAETETLRRRADWAYDDYKNSDYLDHSSKDYHFSQARKYWQQRDAIVIRIRAAGFGDLLDNINMDE